MNLVVGRNGVGKTAFLREVGGQGVPHAWIGPDERPRAQVIRDALSASEHSLLLVDEFENGLHYTVHLDLWRELFRAAELRDVQLFATTHSWDCIRSFTIATHEDRRYHAQLMRLHSGSRSIFSRSEMMAAVRERIEVR